MSTKLPSDWTLLSRDFEQRMMLRLAKSIDRDGARPPQRLLDAMAHTLLAGGKRLRPLLVLESARTATANASRAEATDWAMPAAIAVEFIHTYSLIHDDLPALDNDDLRRGRPTAHIAFDEATAVLAGDALLTDAFGLVSRAQHRAAEQCLELSLACGSSGMVGGQMDDMMSEGQAIDGEHLRAIHARKTGRLFRACCSLGALSVDASEDVLASLDRYASAFGIAFQIADDVLDVIGDADKRGKKIGGDEDREKSTYVRAYGLEEAQRMARQYAEQAIEALAPFESRADNLRQLARFAAERSH